MAGKFFERNFLPVVNSKLTKLKLKIMKKKEVYSTFDLGSAAALISSNIELIEINKTNIKKVQFNFEKKLKTEKIISDYWNDDLKINARTYFDNIKMLKNRIYSN